MKLKEEKEDMESRSFGNHSEADMTQVKMKNFEEVKLPEISKLLNLINGNPTPDIDEDKEEDKEADEIDPNKEILKNHEPAFKIDKVPFLRDHFNEILNNILSVEGQIAMVVFDHVSISKFIKIANSERKKFMKRKEEDPIMNKILETKFSKSLVNFIREHGKEYTKILQDLRKTVRRLVYDRNKLFSYKKKLKKLESKARFSNNFPLSMEDQAKILKAISELKKKGILDFMSLWHIPQRDVDKEYGSDIELSDYEQYYQ